MVYRLFYASAYCKKNRVNPRMPEEGAAMNSDSTSSTSTRLEEVNIFKETLEIFYNLFTWLFAITTLKITHTGKAFFAANYSVLMAIVFAKVLYFLTLVLGTTLQMHTKSLLPTVVILLLEGIASVLALSIISVSIACITLALWLCIFALFGYCNHHELYQLIPERIKTWIESHNPEDPSLPAVTEATVAGV